MSNHAASAATHMDQIYRFQRHIYDFTRKPYLLGRDRLISELDVPNGGHVLEIACGTGRNLISAARTYPHGNFYGFDVSTEMLETAAFSVERSGLRQCTRLAHADALKFDGERVFGQAQFDRIFISYALSMIPQWQQVLQQAIGSLAPGGSLHIVDFHHQRKMPSWFRGGLLTWLLKFSVTPRVELGPFMERLAKDEAMSFRFESLYNDYACYAVLRRPQ